MTRAAAVTPLVRVRATVEPGSVAMAFFQHVISPSVAVAAPDVAPPERSAMFQPAGQAGTAFANCPKWRKGRSGAAADAGTTTLSAVPAPVIVATAPAPPVRITAGSIVNGIGS